MAAKAKHLKKKMRRKKKEGGGTFLISPEGFHRQKRD